MAAWAAGLVVALMLQCDQRLVEVEADRLHRSMSFLSPAMDSMTFGARRGTSSGICDRCFTALRIGRRRRA